jgi:uncharacterized protein DUF1592/uncharacterized protein DUF1588/uncharacterized protein DUF1595
MVAPPRCAVIGLVWLLAAACGAESAQGPGTGGRSGVGGEIGAAGIGGAASVASGTGGALVQASGGVSGGSGDGGAGTLGGGVAGAVGAGGQGASAGGNGGEATLGCAPLPPIGRRLWRLSFNQFASVTQDLLGAAPAPSNSPDSGPPSLTGGPDLKVGPDYLYALYGGAESVLGQIAPRVSEIAACLTGETDDACAARFARSFGLLALRRPLADAEVTDLLKVYAVGANRGFDHGIGLMIEALILSPSFLYRSELGPSPATADPATGAYPDTTLTPYEVATQLGFLLLGSTPDAQLLAAAAATGDAGLATKAGILAQLDRLLALPATRSNLTNVVGTWFRLDEVLLETKDPALLSPLPTADQDIAGELLSSGRQFIADVLWTSDGKVTDLLSSQKVFVDQRLANLYGLPFSEPLATTFVGLTWPLAQPRIGILTQPALLWAVSDPATTNLIRRGRLLHDVVLCQDPVPNEVPLTSPEAIKVETTGDSEVTYSDARLGSALCADCHGQIDPYGRLLQNFDAVGKFTTTDEAGRSVDPSVTFVPPSPLAPASFSGPQAFAAAPVTIGLLSDCAVLTMSGYAIGAPISPGNTCEVNDLRAAFNRSDGTAVALFEQILLADFVRARAGGTN